MNKMHEYKNKQRADEIHNQAKMFLLDKYTSSTEILDRKNIFDHYQNVFLSSNQKVITKSHFFKLLRELFAFKKDKIYCERV